MARYWVGNGGNWNDTNHWATSSGGASGATEPDSSQDVIFDANSFSSSGQTVAINTATAQCRDMTWTGSTNTPTLDFSSGGTRLITIYGSLTLISGMILADNGGDGNINLGSTASGKTITLAGQSIPVDLSFKGDGGSWTLQDALTMTGNNPVQVGGNLNEASTLNTNGKTVTVGNFSSFTVRAGATLILGSSTISLSGPNTGKFDIAGNLTMNSATINYTNITSSQGTIVFRSGSTVDAGTSTINLNGTGGGFYDYVVGVENNTGSPITLYNITFSGPNNYLIGSITFNSFTANSGSGILFESFAADTYTMNTLTMLGLSSAHITLAPDTGGGGEKTTFSAASASIQYVDVQDNTASGAASPFINSFGTDNGGNTNWLFTSVPGVAGALEVNPKMEGVFDNKPVMDRMRPEKAFASLIVDKKPQLYA